MQFNRVVVVGQGYVGLPLAIRMAEVGLNVIGLDAKAHTVDQLNAGKSHIDDVADAEVLAALGRGYTASADATVLAGADVIVVCVPTPLSELGGPDLTAVQSAADLIGQHLTRDTLVVLESTTYPGTTEEFFYPRVNSHNFRLGTDVFVAFSPERVDPGNAAYGIRNTPKVVGGLTSRCTDAAAEFYGMFIDEVVTAKSAKEAEMAKLIENTFRHVNIALMNEMVRFTRDLGVDLWDAIDCASTKPFGFMPFRPGPGVGGHCIPIDPTYLSHRVKARLGYSFRMVELAEEINAAAPGYVASRIASILNEDARAVRGSSVLLLGITYKADIGDARESPADPLAKQLLSRGCAVQYHDPFIGEWKPDGTAETLRCVSDLSVAAQQSDLVVLLQPHSSYDLLSLAKVSKRFLDTRGAMRDTGLLTVELL